MAFKCGQKGINVQGAPQEAGTRGDSQGTLGIYGAKHLAAGRVVPSPIPRQLEDARLGLGRKSGTSHEPGGWWACLLCVAVGGRGPALHWSMRERWSPGLSPHSTSLRPVSRSVVSDSL